MHATPATLFPIHLNGADQQSIHLSTGVFKLRLLFFTIFLVIFLVKKKRGIVTPFFNVLSLPGYR